MQKMALYSGKFFSDYFEKISKKVFYLSIYSASSWFILATGWNCCGVLASRCGAPKRSM
jgi:hypothetical protein